MYFSFLCKRSRKPIWKLFYTMIEGVFFSIIILWKCVTPCMIDPFCIGAFPWRISWVFHPNPTPTPLPLTIHPPPLGWSDFLFCDFQKWTHSFYFKEQSLKRKFRVFFFSPKWAKGFLTWLMEELIFKKYFLILGF